MSKRTKDGTVTIAHVMPWSGMGGVEIATLRLVAATRDRFRHVAFCLADADDLRARFEEMGVEVVTYVAPTPSIRHWSRYYGESQAVARLLRGVGANVVHFAEIKAALHNSLAGLLARCSLVCHVRVSHPHISLRDRLCLLPIDVYVFVSQEAKETFGLPLPAAKARVIYDAVTMPELEIEREAEAVRAELGVAPEETIVGMVARVSPQKDYFTLADAAVKILERFPATRFLVVGDNSLVPLNREHYDAVKTRLDALGIFDRFLFTGHRTDVMRLTCAMDICVLSTHREGFPLSILETMSLAKPMVATSVGGIPEIVKPGVTGYLHEHGDSEGLAAALCRLMESPAEAQRIGLACREVIRSEFGVAKYVDQIATLYRGVSRGSGEEMPARTIHPGAEKVKDVL